MSAVQKVSACDCFPVPCRTYSESLMELHRQESRKPLFLCGWSGAAAADYPENTLSLPLPTWEICPGTVGSSDVSA